MPLSGNQRSIFAMLAAVTFFSFMDAQLKVLAGVYPSVQVAALRGLVGLPLVITYVLWRREAHALLRVRWSLHAVRGVLGVAMLTLFTFSLKALGLAEAYTLFFVAPLLITLLSMPLLRERVSAHSWWAIAAGFGGVLVAMRPDEGAFFSLGALAVLGAAACYALSAILGRVLSRTEPSVTLVFWTTVSMSVGGGLLAWPQWVPLQSEHWPLLAGLAVAGFLGQLAITEAFRHGQAAVVAPFEYTALAWAILLDWLIWRAAPDHYTLLGGAIVIASGLYLVRRARAEAAQI